MSTYTLEQALPQQYLAIVCMSDTATYYVEGMDGSSFEWTVEGGTIITDFNDSVHIVWAEDPGEHTLQVQETTRFGCEGALVVDSVLVSAPQIELGDDSYLCEGDSITIIPEGDYVSFEWMDGSISTSFTSFDGGIVSLTGYDIYGCPASDEVYIELKPRPIVYLGDNTSICDFDALTLDAGPDGISYEWSTGETNSTIEVYQGYQEIWVVVEDEFGCVNTDSIIIEACLFEGLFHGIPTAITPSNQDGKNDVWNIEQLQSFPQAVVDIYDRWGRLIWRSEPGYPTPWDGRDMSGREVPVDSYHYVILLNFADDERITGTITVIR